VKVQEEEKKCKKFENRDNNERVKGKEEDSSNEKEKTSSKGSGTYHKPTKVPPHLEKEFIW
jgi:hypothetical protein